MYAKIRHVALFTEKYERLLKFYQTVFGMKQITTRLADETGQQNAETRPISATAPSVMPCWPTPRQQPGARPLRF
jgi:catechol 2,3-dioxygenase-like lactoylglutathione lyase family enzyme